MTKKLCTSFYHPIVQLTIYLLISIVIDKTIFYIVYFEFGKSSQQLGIFSFQNQVLRPRTNPSFLKIIFLLGHQISRTNSISIVFNFVHNQKNPFSKNVLNFLKSWPKLHFKLSKNLSNGSFGCNYWLNFTCHTNLMPT